MCDPSFFGPRPAHSPFNHIKKMSISCLNLRNLWPFGAHFLVFLYRKTVFRSTAAHRDQMGRRNDPLSMILYSLEMDLPRGLLLPREYGRLVANEAFRRDTL